MLKSPLLFAVSVLISLLSWTGVAQASDAPLALSFALPAASSELTESRSKGSQHNQPINKTDDTSELSRYKAPLPPITAPQTIERVEPDNISTPEQIGLTFAETQLRLPAEPAPTRKAFLQNSNQAIDNRPEASATKQAETRSIEILGVVDDWIFEGGSDSLVAHTVGSAEGTRHWNGQKTNAYYGHKDPGNGVWNLGTFSYQHAAKNPEEADAKQLKRLKNQGLQLEQQATTFGRSLSLEEKLNGLDLANQAPLAALGQGGYVERLDQAYRLEMKGFEAISWARTRSYIDPDTKAWNAPGLGNNLYSISQDQERRMAAINQALRAYDRNGLARVALANLEKISLQSPKSNLADQASAEVAPNETRTSVNPAALSQSAVSFGLPASETAVPKTTPDITPDITPDTPDTTVLGVLTAQIDTPISQNPALSSQVTASAVEDRQPAQLSEQPPSVEPSLEEEPIEVQSTQINDRIVVKAHSQEYLNFADTSPEIMPTSITAELNQGLIDTQPSPVLEQVIHPNQARQEDAPRESAATLQISSSSAVQSQSTTNDLDENEHTPAPSEKPSDEEEGSTRPWWSIHSEDKVINRK